MIYVLVPILAVLPAIFWFFVFLRQDRLDPEPKSLIFKLFLLGSLGGLVASILEIALLSFFPSSFQELFLNVLEEPVEQIKSIEFLLSFGLLMLIFAAIEEILKITVVREFTFYHPHFTQVVDGAIFGISSALGFATLENIVYLFEGYFQAGFSALALIFVIRFFASTLLHALTTGIAGYYLGKAKFSVRKGVFWQGLAAAIIIHSVFNLALSAGLVGLLIVTVLLISVLVFLLRKVSSVEAQTVWRLVLFKTYKNTPSQNQS